MQVMVHSCSNHEPSADEESFTKRGLQDGEEVLSVATTRAGPMADRLAIDPAVAHSDPNEHHEQNDINSHSSPVGNRADGQPTCSSGTLGVGSAAQEEVCAAKHDTQQITASENSCAASEASRCPTHLSRTASSWLSTATCGC